MSINLMSAIFRTEFRDLQDTEGNNTKASTAKFVCIALADHANDEGEGAYPSIAKLAYKTSLSRTTIINALDALKFNGILTANGTSKWDTVNYTVNSECFSRDSQPALLVNPLAPPSQAMIPPQSSDDTPPVKPLDPNHPLTIHKPSIKPFKQKTDFVDAILEQATQANAIKETTDFFEKTFGFGALNWDSSPTWRKFAKWIYAKKDDLGGFKEYVTWRNGKGQYKGAMTNTAIRRDPQIFMDTGWPTFLAYTSMYPNGETSGASKQDQSLANIQSWLSKQEVNHV